MAKYVLLVISAAKKCARFWIIKLTGGAIDIQTLRSRLTIIPQEPVLFSGTLRFNLDPSNDYKDNELWNVLKQVKIADNISVLGGGLDLEVAENGYNLSLG